MRWKIFLLLQPGSVFCPIDMPPGLFCLQVHSTDLAEDQYCSCMCRSSLSISHKDTGGFSLQIQVRSLMFSAAHGRMCSSDLKKKGKEWLQQSIVSHWELGRSQSLTLSSPILSVRRYRMFAWLNVSGGKKLKTPKDEHKLSQQWVENERKGRTRKYIL